MVDGFGPNSSSRLARGKLGASVAEAGMRVCCCCSFARAGVGVPFPELRFILNLGSTMACLLPERHMPVPCLAGRSPCGLHLMDQSPCVHCLNRPPPHGLVLIFACVKQAPGCFGIDQFLLLVLFAPPPPPKWVSSPHCCKERLGDAARVIS